MIRIVTDSTASIPAKIAEEHGIEVVTLYLHRGEEMFEDATMDVDAFYEGIYDMIDDIPTSSQPSQVELENVFEQAARRGDEAIGIFMSSRMSGTLDSALCAARSVSARHANFRFRIVDSMSNSFDEAWSVLAAAAARAAGRTLNHCAKLAVESATASRFLFTPESLKFLKAGGRIGNAAALLGTLIKLCPVFTVSDGLTTTFAKVRTHRKAVETIAEKFRSDIEAHGLKNVVVHYIGSSDEACVWARDVIGPMCGRDVDVVPVSPVIGLHVGPAVGIAYECQEALPGRLSLNPSSLVYAS